MNLTEAAKTTMQSEKRAVEKARGGDPTALSYVKSFHIIRTAVGVMGAALPVILIFGWRILHGEWNLLGSLSAYYHTGVRDAFVSILVVVGVLLIAYKLASGSADSYLGTLAGLAAMGVAFIPTKIDPEKQPYASNTAVQDWLGEDLARWIHYICAVTFIVLLGFICLLFARLEREKEVQGLSRPDQWRSSTSWSRFHTTAAGIIFASLVGIAVTQLLKVGNEYSLLVGEILSILAFSASWFVKGLDLKILRADTEDAGDH